MSNYVKYLEALTITRFNLIFKKLDFAISKIVYEYIIH